MNTQENTNMSSAIIAKSDQLNSDDLIGGGITIEVTKVSVSDSSEQKVSISYKGDNGKPYKPCKSMCRVIVNAWGADGALYIGRLMTLYRDADVTWGGMKVGGIRISHLSHIDGTMLMSLTATRGSKKGYTVKPLAAPTATAIIPLTSEEFEDAYIIARKGSVELQTWWKGLASQPGQQKRYQEKLDHLKEIARIVDENVG